MEITNVGSITSTATDQNWTRNTNICPSFLLFGRTRRSTLLGDKRRTNASNMGESLWQQEKASWLEEASATQDSSCVVWYRSKKAADEICSLFELSQNKRADSERGSRIMLGSQSSHCNDTWNKFGLCWQEQGCWVERTRQWMSSTTDRYQAGILDGHR